MPLPNGLGARRYASYRPTRHGDVALAVTNEDEATHKAQNITASGNTEILVAPSATKNIIIKGLSYSNVDSTVITVSLRAGVDGPEKFKFNLAVSGGSIDLNLIGRYWRLPLGKSLVAVLSAAGDVLVNIQYESEDEPGEESVILTDTIAIAEESSRTVGGTLADTQTFAEALVDTVVVAKTETVTLAEATAKTVSDVLADSQSFAEAPSKTVSDVLADAQSFAEGISSTDVSSVLADNMTIAESVANKHTLSISDAQTIVDSNILITYTPGP